jgi:hypothetical protein
MTYLIILNVVLVILVCWVAYKSGNDKAFILTEVERQMNHFVEYKDETGKELHNMWVTTMELGKCLSETNQAFMEYVQMNNAIQKDMAESISLLAAGKEKTVH